MADSVHRFRRGLSWGVKAFIVVLSACIVLWFTFRTSTLERSHIFSLILIPTALIYAYATGWLVYYGRGISTARINVEIVLLPIGGLAAGLILFMSLKNSLYYDDQLLALCMTLPVPPACLAALFILYRRDRRFLKNQGPGDGNTG